MHDPLTALAMRVLQDDTPQDNTPQDDPPARPPRTMVYCFAHHIDNLYMMRRGLKRRGIRSVCLLDNVTAMSGVSSGAETRRAYEDDGFAVTGIPFAHESINTKLESDVVVDWAVANEYTHIIAVAPPFHALRAIMTLVSSVMDKGASIHVSCCPGETNDWRATSVTHQGKTISSGKDLLAMELERIARYTDAGDIRPVDDIWAYFDQRPRRKAASSNTSE